MEQLLLRAEKIQLASSQMISRSPSIDCIWLDIWLRRWIDDFDLAINGISFDYESDHKLSRSWDKLLSFQEQLDWLDLDTELERKELCDPVRLDGENGLCCDLSSLWFHKARRFRRELINLLERFRQSTDSARLTAIDSNNSRSSSRTHLAHWPRSVPSSVSTNERSRQLKSKFAPGDSQMATW